MNIASLENWLSELDETPNKIKKFIWTILLAPILFILEFICWIKIWRKIVLPSLMETEEIFAFFETNDFVYRKWFRLSKFEKIDIVPIDNQYYAGIKDVVKLRHAIRNEYINTLLDIIDKYSPFDLQNYISLQCAITYGPQAQRIYKITIQYWRHTIIVKRFINMIFWLIGFGGFGYITNTIITQFFG